MAVDYTDPNVLAVAKVKAIKDTLFFTRFFFKQQYGTKFVIGEHHRKIAAKLDDVYAGRCKRLIINIAPRYGKTELAVKMFMAKGLALNPKAKFIHLSYSKKLALDNSATVRDLVKMPIYQQMFPDVMPKRGSDAVEKWYTEQHGGVYATASGGQITGFGAGLVDKEKDEFDLQDPDRIGESIDDDFFNTVGEFGGAIIIDDPIKPEDAESEVRRTSVNDRFDSTIINRVNSRNTPIIVIMQRLHTEDLCGHLQEKYKGFEVLSLPVINEDGTALWPHKHTVADLEELRQANEYVFDTQMMQDPRPKFGLMFPKEELRHFRPMPNMKFDFGCGYIDVADEGEDFLSFPIGQVVEKDIYIPEVVFDDGQQLEESCAVLIKNRKPEYVRIESNNGGNFFRQSLERLVDDVMLLPSRATTNKHARIRAAAGFIKKYCVFVDPKYQTGDYKKFYENLTRYTKNGKGVKHDDAADSLAGLVRMIASFYSDLYEEFAGIDDLREPDAG